MQTLGYQHSEPWQHALSLINVIGRLNATFENDPFSLAGKLRSIAADLPIQAALCFEQLDYDAVASHCADTRARLFQLELNAQLAAHLKLLTPKQLGELTKHINKLDNTLANLPDELFEDDGADERNQAA